MARELIVSTGDALQVISPEGICRKSAALKQAGALCALESHVFCACGDTVWKLDKEALEPVRQLAGGPGMCELLLSGDGRYMYALCAEADSVLMVSTRTGEPLLLNRAGVNPREMVLDGEILAIAGGESGLVLLMSAGSLRLLETISMPGPVYSVALRQGCIHALCMTATLSSQLITHSSSGARFALDLDGMPGRLLAEHNRLLAATEGALHVISPCGKWVQGSVNLPGRAVFMARMQGETWVLDGYSERLFAAGHRGLRMIGQNIKHAAVLNE